MVLRIVVLASHGSLSKGMYDSVKMIAGESTVHNVRTYSLQPGESALDFASKLREEIEKNPQNEYVVISDVFGGSVHSALMQMLTLENMVLFSGMNMSLVLEVLMAHNEFNEAECARLCNSGCSGIKSFTSKSVKEILEIENF